MPDNFVPIEIVYDLYVRACRNAENLPSFCSGTAKSQLRRSEHWTFCVRSNHFTGCAKAVVLILKLSI